MRIPLVAVIAFTMVPLFAQSPQSTGTVSPTVAEFRIPLQHPADEIWTWNRADTPDNAIEYSWTVTVASGPAQYSFGFYLYKLPGSRESRGHVQELLKAGQNSVFKDDAEGRRSELLPDAKVEVAVESRSILVRIADPKLVRLIFRERPETVAIRTRTPSADYQIVRVEYRD
jgi:hypothetical protein